MITPIEIQNKTFKSGGLGYDKRDVDQFMKEVLSGYETIYRENVDLKIRFLLLQTHYNNISILRRPYRKH